MQARYAGHCTLCGTPILAGADIGKHKRQWVHINCRPSDDSAADREYWKGRGEADRYCQDVKFVGQELADQWEMEAQMARYNRGEEF